MEYLQCPKLMPNNEPGAEVSDTTDDDSSIGADPIILTSEYLFCYFKATLKRYETLKQLKLFQ